MCGTILLLPPHAFMAWTGTTFSFFTKFVPICLMMLLQLLRIRNIEWYGHLFSSNIKGETWRAYISSLRKLRHHFVVRNTYSVLKQHKDKGRQNRIVQISILLTVNCGGFPLILVMRLLSSSSPWIDIFITVFCLQFGFISYQYLCFFCGLFYGPVNIVRLFLARQPPVGQGPLIHEVSRSHTTHHSR
jgi:hypothetical protein